MWPYAIEVLYKGDGQYFHVGNMRDYDAARYAARFYGYAGNIVRVKEHGTVVFTSCDGKEWEAS